MTDCGNSGFERPVIDWKKFYLQKPGAGTVLKEIDGISEKDFWHSLLNEFAHQGLSLGIRLEMPILKSVKHLELKVNNKLSRKPC